MRFPFVPSEEANCFTNSFDPEYTDCLVVRKYSFLDVLDLCYLGTVLPAFLFCQTLCLLPLSIAHTGVYTNTHTPATQAQLLPLWFVWF